MQKLIFVFLLLCIQLHALEPKKKINLIWQNDRIKIWEPDWILEMLSDFEINEVCDGNFEVYMDNAIIVTNRPHEYFSIFKEKNYKFGIIHISDEVYSCSTDFYEDALFVFRNYWHKKFAKDTKVSFLALGYKQGFWNNCTKPQIKSASEREYIWSFAGQIIDHPTRWSMLVNMQAIPNYYLHQTFAFWDANALTVSEYRDLLLESIFIPCPTGYWNLDSFRVYEALECGCIPIVEKQPLDYFRRFFGDNPFIAIDTWDQAPALISDLLDDPVQLEDLRQRCHEWWLEYKKELKNRLTATIEDSFFPKPI